MSSGILLTTFWYARCSKKKRELQKAHGQEVFFIQTMERSVKLSQLRNGKEVKIFCMNYWKIRKLTKSTGTDKQIILPFKYDL